MTDEEIKKILRREFETYELSGLELAAFKLGWEAAIKQMKDKK